MHDGRVAPTAQLAEAGRASRLIGRDADLSQLLAALERGAAGAGSAVLVAGEAGIGKTWLVKEAAARASGPALWATCWAGDGAPAFWPWIQVLRTLLSSEQGLGLRSSAPDDVAQVSRLLGEPAPGGSGGDARLRLFDSVVRVLRLAATRQPLLLVLEDVHWADEPSIRLLHFLTRALHDTRLVVIATYRDTDVSDEDPLGRCLGELAEAGGHLTLLGLDTEPLSRLLSDLVGDTVPVAQLVDVVHAQTGGNPFFVGELVRLLQAEHRLSDLAVRPTVAVPGSVRAVLARRLARVPQRTHDVLRAASSIGAEFDVGVLGDVTGHDAGGLLAALDEARAARLIVEVRASPGRFRFIHALVREVLYEALPLATRAALHRRVGVAIERRGADDAHVAVLAHHFLRAGGDDADRAVGYAARAGSRARQLLAYEEAAGWYEQALSTLRLLPAAQRRGEGELVLALGEARAAAGNVRARDAYLWAAELARHSRDARQLARAALGLSADPSGFEVPLFDQPQIDLLEEALDQLGAEDSGLRARLLARLSVALSFLESEQRRLTLSEQAVEMSQRLGDRSALGHALAVHCDATAGPDHSETRQREAEDVVRLGRETDDAALELLGRRLRLVALLEQGRVAEADAEIDAFERVAERLRQPLHRWYVPLWRGMRALMRGDLAESQRCCDSAAAIGAEAHSDNAAMLTASQRWLRLRAEGRFRDAGQLLQDAFVPFEQLAGGVGSLTMSLLQAGRTEEARDLLPQWVAGLRTRTWDAEWLGETCLLAQVAVVLADHELAARLMEDLRPYAHRFAVEGIASTVPGSVSWYLALLARHLGRDEEADEHAARAGEAHARAGITQEPPPVVAPPVPTRRLPAQRAPADSAALRRDGDTWAISYAGRTVRVRDSKGLHDLAALLLRPGQEMHVAELAGSVVSASTGAALDATALAAYRRRLTDLEDDLTEAEVRHDSGHAERLRTERDFLVAELGRSLGLTGRSRRPGDPVERARKTVTARLRYSIARIGALHPSLGRHLSNSVRTGTFCSYQPEHPVVWQH